MWEDPQSNMAMLHAHALLHYPVRTRKKSHPIKPGRSIPVAS